MQVHKCLQIQSFHGNIWSSLSFQGTRMQEYNLLSDRAMLLIAALLLSAVAGGPRAFYQQLGLHRPALWIVSAMRTLERKLNREKRTVQARRVRGMVVTLATLLVAT